ncbi:uncharacterized protein with alpha-helical domain and ER motif [Nocardia ignorata]|uniref:Uncharacterized protein with alpha-helical domain and ER motif n=1 Tax=Nocardia ignorata TaxID=145285 RepID=A0A4R6PJC2_NOCIG|nr:uncharacterized protein with alpha-helical domain and ER motif [Nocardia ignorata]
MSFEDATVDADRTSRVLLEVLGIEPPVGLRLDVWSVTDLVAFSHEHGVSISESIAKARENARGAREVASSEMWECLNTTYNGLAAPSRPPVGSVHTNSSPTSRTARRCSPD